MAFPQRDLLEQNSKRKNSLIIRHQTIRIITGINPDHFVAQLR